MIDELFIPQKIQILEDRLHQEKVKLVELSGQVEYQRFQASMFEAETVKLDAEIARSAAEISVITAELRLVLAQLKQQQVMDEISYS